MGLKMYPALIFILAGIILSSGLYAGDSECGPRVSAGSGHCQTVRPDGTVWGWGMVYAGNLADGSAGGHKFTKKEPRQAKSANGGGFLAEMTDISCSVITTCGLRKDGTVWCWGYGEYGQMGNGTKRSSSLPTQVKSPDGNGVFEKAVAVAAGHTHACALKKDGTVWVWGLNDRGQLGNGSTVEQRSLPVQVRTPDGKGFLQSIVAIAAGVGHCLALKNDGTVFSWGENVVGQLGDNTTADRFLPVKVKEFKDVVSVGCGWHHSLAVCKDGTLWGWGYNIFGQLGDGGAWDRHAPVQTKSPDGKDFIRDVSKAVGGSLHTLIIKKDGSLWALGGNHFGQLGCGRCNERESLPVQVKAFRGRGFLVNTVDADGGSVHSTAVTRDGTVYCWGDNYRSQVGDPSVPCWAWILKGEYVDGATVMNKKLYRKGAFKVPGPPWPWPARLPSARAAGIIQAIRKVGPESQDKIPAYLDDKEMLVRLSAIKALGSIKQKSEKVIAGLLKGLKDKDKSVRYESLKALGKCDPAKEGVVASVVEALEDESSTMRKIAVRTLGDFGSSTKAAVAPLWDLARKGEDLSGEAFEMLAVAGENAVPMLVEALGYTENVDLRRNAALSLAKMGSNGAQKAVPALAKALSDKDVKIREYAAWALGKVGPAAKEAVEALKKAAKDENTKVRFNAVNALKRINKD